MDRGCVAFMGMVVREITPVLCMKTWGNGRVIEFLTLTLDWGMWSVSQPKKYMENFGMDILI
jgi:hypothetical protein